MKSAFDTARIKLCADKKNYRRFGMLNMDQDTTTKHYTFATPWYPYAPSLPVETWKWLPVVEAETSSFVPSPTAVAVTAATTPRWPRPYSPHFLHFPQYPALVNLQVSPDGTHEWSQRPDVNCSFFVMDQCYRTFENEGDVSDCIEGSRDAHLLDRVGKSRVQSPAYQFGFYGTFQCPWS